MTPCLSRTGVTRDCVLHDRGLGRTREVGSYASVRPEGGRSGLLHEVVRGGLYTRVLGHAKPAHPVPVGLMASRYRWRSSWPVTWSTRGGKLLSWVCQY